MSFSYKSAISFGLVFVPVSLHLTVRTQDIGFNMLYRKTGERIRYKKTCTNCPPDLTGQDIVRGYEYQKGKYVTITNEELDAIKTERDKSIEISSFVALDEIDPVFFEKSYYIKPLGAEKAFKLIQLALESKGLVGIAKTVLGQKDQLVALRAVGGNMLLYTLHFNDEVQPAPKIADEVVTDAELKLAKDIIANMTMKFNPKDYRDEFRTKLRTAINAKIAGKRVATTRSKAQTAKILTLMDALKASVDLKKKKPGGQKNATKSATTKTRRQSA